MRKYLYARLCRFVWIILPCSWGGGGNVSHLSPDFRSLTVRLKLNLRTINIMGTIFGGSMYASTDPMFMLMLMKILGKDYVVWDKGCAIRFKRPAKTTIYCHFVITDQMLDEVLSKVANDRETTVTWTVQYKDSDGTVYSEFDKVLYVSTKQHYDAKQAARRARVGG